MTLAGNFQATSIKFTLKKIKKTIDFTPVVPEYGVRTAARARDGALCWRSSTMNIHLTGYTAIDTDRYIEDSRRFRMGEPSGMLVAIAALARLIQRGAGRIERWARRPEQVEYLPRIPVR